MHSDQTRKDGSSESIIQALYYDFVANYVKTRMYSTRYVQCNSGGQSSADRGATESGSAEVLSSQRSCYSTECEETGHLVVGEAGVGVTPGPSHWKSRSMWSCYSLSGLMYSTSVTVVILSLAKVHECMQKFICLLPGRGVCLGAIVWMIKVNYGMYRRIVNIL